MALCLDAGAKEVWLCVQSGAMRFFGPGTTHAMRTSKICPHFPKQIELP
jgi:hypothetical protein